MRFGFSDTRNRVLPGFKFLEFVQCEQKCVARAYGRPGGGVGAWEGILAGITLNYKKLQAKQDESAPKVLRKVETERAAVRPGKRSLWIKISRNCATYMKITDATHS